MVTMRVTSKIRQHSGQRKVIEVPASVRDNFQVGDIVIILTSMDAIKKENGNYEIDWGSLK